MGYFILEVKYIDGGTNSYYGHATEIPDSITCERLAKGRAKAEDREVESASIIPITKEDYTKKMGEPKPPLFL